MTSQAVITVLKRALNLLDYRVIEHGQRVMYLVYRMLKKEQRYSDSDLHQVCFLCALHDIGAYKTEPLDALDGYVRGMRFELHNTTPHSVYGYLFLKNFSILSRFSDAVLFHHCRYDRLQATDCTNKELAAKLFLAGRIDLLLTMGRLKLDETLFYEYRDTVFSAHDIDLVLQLEREEHIQEKLVSGAYQQEIELLYPLISFSEEQLNSFFKTIAYLIDFRSEYTVLHTIATVNFSTELAKRMGLAEDAVQKIYCGALLHDVGKISTPLAVLEKSEKLDDFEYTIIKDHVVMSEFILKGCVDDEILQIAIRHHEKLDGSGYPRGLSARELTLPQQIVCVADILSALYGKRSYKPPFPPRQICGILSDMAQRGLISKAIVAVVLSQYDSIVAQVERSCGDTIGRYQQMNADYRALCQVYDGT